MKKEQNRHLGVVKRGRNRVEKGSKKSGKRVEKGSNKEQKRHLGVVKRGRNRVEKGSNKEQKRHLGVAVVGVFEVFFVRRALLEVQRLPPPDLLQEQLGAGQVDGRLYVVVGEGGTRG